MELFVLERRTNNDAREKKKKRNLLLYLNNVSPVRGRVPTFSLRGSHLGFTKKPLSRAREVHLTHCIKGIYLNADLDHSISATRKPIRHVSPG